VTGGRVGLKIQRKLARKRKDVPKCGLGAKSPVTRPGGDEIVLKPLSLSQKRKNPTGRPAGSNATENCSIQIYGRARVGSTNYSMNMRCYDVATRTHYTAGIRRSEDGLCCFVCNRGRHDTVGKLAVSHHWPHTICGQADSILPYPVRAEILLDSCTLRLRTSANP
jgi:hypothetical protein